MAFDRSAWPLSRIVTTLLAVVIAVGGLWVAVAIPGTHPYLNGDAGGVQDWTIIKMVVGFGSLFVAGLVATIAKHIGE